MPFAVRLALEAIIVSAILLVVLYGYLAARRHEHERGRLMPPDEERARFDEILREHERMKERKR